MANEIQIFENGDFGKIRTVVIDNEPWFVGKDVCEIFGDKNHNRSIGRVDDVDKSIFSIPTNGGKQSITIVNESGLYALLFAMQPQKANKGVSNAYPLETQERIEKLRKFKHWVTSEVLPSLRKTGGYISNSELFVNTYFDSVPDEQKTLIRGLITNIEEKQKENIKLKNTNELLVAETLTWADRPLLNAIVRRYAGYACNGDFSYAWVEFKKEILYKYSININARITAYLNKTGKKTKPKTLDMLTDDELVDALKTVVSMCENKGVDISDLLDKKKNEK